MADRPSPRDGAAVALKASIIRVLAVDKCACCGASWWVLASLAVDGTRTCSACVLRRRRAFGRLSARHGGAA